MHKLEWYEEESMTGQCSECGLVKVYRRKNAGKYQFRCSVAKTQQRGWKPEHKRYSYKMGDGSMIHLKNNERKEILSVFGDCCQICGSQDSLKLDHDHQTGKFRGVLCHHCNVGLGNFKDSSELLDKAKAYLLTG